MHKVYTAGDDDCLRACVASLLEKPLESIPNFAVRSGHAWFEDLYIWCLRERIGMILIHPKDLLCSLFFNLLCIMVFSVPGMDDAHAVIGRCERVETKNNEWKSVTNIEHDPNKDGITLGTLEGMIFLVPDVPVHEANP